jgi:hypothetical protein
MGFKIEWKSGTREQWHAEDGEGFERVLSYHMRAYSLRRSKQVRVLAVVSLVVSCRWSCRWSCRVVSCVALLTGPCRGGLV